MNQPNPTCTSFWPNDVLARGTVLNGYRITRILGRGGFGVTYLAEDVLGQSFALKEYFPRQFALRQGEKVHAASEEEAPIFDDCRGRFMQEARALLLLGQARGSRDDIVRVQTFFEANGTAYMVMEYVRGRSLQAALRDRPGGMPEAELRRFLAYLLAGLSTVHSAGLMHRDIKPSNILLREDGRPVLIDFGSSREAGSQQTGGFTQIFSGGHAPPEQILGTRQGPFSDIYAVGTVCYAAIGGRVTDSLARQNAFATGAPDPMPPAALIGAGRYAPDLLAVIDAALAIDPADRPASAAEVACLLQASHSNDETVLTRVRVKSVSPRFSPSRRAIVGGIVLAVTLLAVIVAAWLWFSPNTTLMPDASTLPPAVRSTPPALATAPSAPEPPPPQAPAEQTTKPPAPPQTTEAPPTPTVPNQVETEPPSTHETPAPQLALPAPSQIEPPISAPSAPTVGPPNSAPSDVPHRAAVPLQALPRPAPPHIPRLSTARCADITARVQLGETLTDADRTALRTTCKP